MLNEISGQTAPSLDMRTVTMIRDKSFIDWRNENCLKPGGDPAIRKKAVGRLQHRLCAFLFR
jgi:hypothetical protein